MQSWPEVRHHAGAVWIHPGYGRLGTGTNNLLSCLCDDMGWCPLAKAGLSHDLVSLSLSENRYYRPLPNSKWTIDFTKYDTTQAIIPALKNDKFGNCSYSIQLPKLWDRISYVHISCMMENSRASVGRKWSIMCRNERCDRSKTFWLT